LWPGRAAVREWPIAGWAWFAWGCRGFGAVDPSVERGDATGQGDDAETGQEETVDRDGDREKGQGDDGQPAERVW
jgi:hypothetical protein